MCDCNTVLQDGDKIFIWDNSPSPQSTNELNGFSTRLKCETEYRNTPENISLAKIYNAIIDENPDFATVCFFDQDSQFDRAYFQTLTGAGSEAPEIGLFLPLIIHNNTIVSPGHFHYFKGKYWESIHYGIVKTKNTTAIMSGIAVRMSHLAKFGIFDERLKIYGVDTNFMIRFSRENDLLYVMDVPFQHDLSDFNDEAASVKIKRFEDFKKASIINAQLFPLPIRILTHLFLWYRTLRLPSS